MQRLIVLGIDGLSTNILKSVRTLPTFNRLIKKGFSGVLKNNIIPLHSAPSWITMFTGVKPEMHGIIGFTKADGSFFSRKDLHYPFIWETLKEEMGIESRALHICCFVPAINYRVNFQFSVDHTLPVTPNEALKSLYLLTEKLIEVLSDEPEFLVTIYPHLDRILHLKYDEPTIVSEALKQTDICLSEILNVAKGYDLLIVSDHGFTDIETSREMGISGFNKHVKNITGDHHPDGIYITTTPMLVPKPAEITQITPTILSFFKKTHKRKNTP